MESGNKRKEYENKNASQNIRKKQRIEIKYDSVLEWANKNEECIKEKVKWKRKNINPINQKTDSIVFQQMDIKYYMENIDQQKSKSNEETVPVIKMYGCTNDGNSVLLSVYGVQPYFYVPVPVSKLTGNIDPILLCSNFRMSLNNAMKSRLENKSDQPCKNYVQVIEIEQKLSIMGYQEETIPFFKIIFSCPPHVPTARTILEEGIHFNGINSSVTFTTFESNIAFVLRFMIDHSIGGASWIELPAGKYNLIKQSKHNCQIEAEIFEEDLICHPVESEKWAHVAPLRILSFDIECAGKPGAFPDPQHDPIIQIANYVTINGEDKPHVKNIFVLDTCTSIIGSDVRCYQTEKELLNAWKEFVMIIDPDIFTGYNIVNFDFGYLVDRASALKLDKFDQLTRLSTQKLKYKDSKFSSMQTGTRESKEWSCEGRIVFDVYQVVQKDYKLSSYSLNNVSAKFLKQQKEDVHHSMISKLHAGSPDDRRRLAVYCLKDAYLPQKLLDNLMALTNYIEMARVTGIPFSYLLVRGQGIKVVSQILRKTRELGYVTPTLKPSGSSETYEGAKVISPKTGFYKKPIATLDFSSLYPSIMQAHNLCYTTLISDYSIKKYNISSDDYETTPLGYKFIKASKKKGILPLILDSLLAARGNAKKLMAKETDKNKQQVYNGRQLALKVSCNSVYGFTGQSVGALPCFEISSSITAYGREMILFTRDIILDHYTIKNGYSANADVIYGDTDSVMVDFGFDNVSDAIDRGREAAKFITSKFPKPINLEFEKVYYPWLLMAKKKYAGLFWSKKENYDKMDCKGIESVRRDNCGMVRYVVDTCLKKILIELDVNGAIEFCKKIISEVLQNRIDISLLIITKSLSKSSDEYSNPQAHVALAERMKKRNPETAPNIGDRVPYVIIKGDKKTKISERAEDPLWVLEQGLIIDTQYYLEQLINPLCRLFEPLHDNPRNLFMTGEHTRQLSIPTPKSTIGGIMKFTSIRESCLGCKAVLNKSEKALCQHCISNASDYYSFYLNKTREKEMQFSRLWTQCQRCQGSLHQEVICTARDCQIYYMRTKVYKDLVEAKQSLAKFDSDFF
jgi:DNA polymerase delta subunit 1